MEQAGLAPDDRAWMMDVCAGVLRWRGRIDMALDAVALQKKPSGYMRKILSIAAYQLMMQEKVPAALVVSETVDEVKRKEGDAPARFANAVLRKIADHAKSWREMPFDPKAKMQDQAKWASLPEWFWKKLVRDHGLEWAKEYALKTLERPELWVRAQQPEKFVEEWGTAVAPGAVPASFRMIERPKGPVNEWKGFEKGKFFVQDISSQWVVDQVTAQLKNRPGFSSLRVLDYCAAPGGKTIGMAWNGVAVESTDSSSERFALLQESVKRLANSVRLIHTSEQEQIPISQYDLVWVDAPCTGSGLIGKHPDLRWGKTEDQLSELVQIQSKLWKKIWDRLKPGAWMVYSVCSVLADEGPGHFKSIQNNNGQVLGEWLLCPQQSPFGEGFWATLIQKN